MRTKKHEEYLKRSTFNSNKKHSPYEYASLEELASILGEDARATYKQDIQKQPVKFCRLPRF